MLSIHYDKRIRLPKISWNNNFLFWRKSTVLGKSHRPWTLGAQHRVN